MVCTQNQMQPPPSLPPCYYKFLPNKRPAAVPPSGIRVDSQAALYGSMSAPDESSNFDMGGFSAPPPPPAANDGFNDMGGFGAPPPPPDNGFNYTYADQDDGFGSGGFSARIL